MVSSKRLLVLAVVGLVALAPLAAFAFLLFPPDFAYSHYSSYSYTTSVSTNATVENATLLLPFPQGEDVEADLSSNLWLYDDDGNRLTDWDASVVETARGPMLRLHADRLVGEDRYVLWTYADNGSVVDRREISRDEIPEEMTNRELVAHPTTYSISWQVTVDHDIETRDPLANGTFLAPISDATTVDCRAPWSETDNCARFASTVSATYETDGPATVTVGEIRFEGWNEWGFWLSNSFNTFEATTTPAVYTDGRRGWTVVDGELHAGMGRYDGPSR
ncbi:hypothetical protein SAMN04487948_104189 [Halogranum amylolyticum]|uniref:Uncharacterized protein n=1 Tax=Halogranum amylolyticum TaxID=660520 RepID=A0A1H8RR61_9EURY|nr:hypothetical protein [Halogranum amylolyticum]SEO68961.1 hypothetical protein SAMN04487948_104189 [Halogranum amylolyticum]